MEGAAGIHESISQPMECSGCALARRGAALIISAAWRDDEDDDAAATAEEEGRREAERPAHASVASEKRHAPSDTFIEAIRIQTAERSTATKSATERIESVRRGAAQAGGWCTIRLEGDEEPMSRSRQPSLTPAFDGSAACTQRPMHPHAAESSALCVCVH